jgi:hypothetical protein
MDCARRPKFCYDPSYDEQHHSLPNHRSAAVVRCDSVCVEFGLSTEEDGLGRVSLDDLLVQYRLRISRAERDTLFEQRHRH